jgi:predicted aspartyl protease
LANAILSDDMQTLGQILEQIYKARRDTNARRAADIVGYCLSHSNFSNNPKSSLVSCFQNRLNENPFDEELQKKIEEEIRMEVVNRNMEEAMEHNPEAFGSVIMLYIDCKVNNTPVKAFVDSGAQITLMSAQTAERCGIMQFLDRRFARTLVGVGSCQALGRIHIASLMLGNSVFVSSFTIVEDSSVDFLLGLDMLRKHRVSSN